MTTTSAAASPSTSISSSHNAQINRVRRGDTQGYSDVRRVAPLDPSTPTLLQVQKRPSSSVYSAYSLEFSQSSSTRACGHGVGEHDGEDGEPVKHVEGSAIGSGGKRAGGGQTSHDTDSAHSRHDRDVNLHATSAAHPYPPTKRSAQSLGAAPSHSRSASFHSVHGSIFDPLDDEINIQPPAPPQAPGPKRPSGSGPGGVGKQLRWFWLGSWINVLLLCIPVAWGLHFGASSNYIPIFIFSFFGIIPLARLLSEATDEMSNHVGQTVAGILNATFGNVVELIVAIIAIVKCELQITQSSLAGSILSNLLLVLGMSYFVGGIRYSQQEFVTAAAQTYSTLLILSVTAVLLPAGFHFAVQPDETGSSEVISHGLEAHELLSLSHGAAVILIITYCIFLYFQMWTHEELFDAAKEKCESTGYVSVNKKPFYFRRKRRLSKKSNLESQKNGIELTESSQNVKDKEDEVEVEEQHLSKMMGIILLLAVTVLVAVTADCLVASIDGVTTKWTWLKKEWVGLILLPIAANAAEHYSAVVFAYKDKLTMSISIAVGSSIQIALFVVPLSVIFAWIFRKPLFLLFDPFESVCLFLAVLLVNYCNADGKSNWLEGWVLMIIYIIIAVSFWYYPGIDIQSSLQKCT